MGDLRQWTVQQPRFLSLEPFSDELIMFIMRCSLLEDKMADTVQQPPAFTCHTTLRKQVGFELSGDDSV